MDGGEPLAAPREKEQWLPSNSYHIASGCAVTEGLRTLCCLLVVWSQVCLQPPRPAARHKMWRLKYSKSTRWEKPIWVWDRAAMQQERFCLGLLSCRWPGQVTPAQQAGVTAQTVRGWVPRTDHANCLNPPEENAWAPWERAARGGQTSRVVNPMLNSSSETHRSSPPCCCHSVLSCFSGQCCSTSSQLLGHLSGHHHAAQQPLAATGSRAYPDTGQLLAFATSQRNSRPRHGKRNSSFFQFPLEQRCHFLVWHWKSRPRFRE